MTIQLSLFSFNLFRSIGAIRYRYILPSPQIDITVPSKFWSRWIKAFSYSSIYLFVPARENLGGLEIRVPPNGTFCALPLLLGERPFYIAKVTSLLEVVLCVALTLKNGRFLDGSKRNIVVRPEMFIAIRVGQHAPGLWVEQPHWMGWFRMLRTTGPVRQHTDEWYS